jgi:hypothetical protein
MGVKKKWVLPAVITAVVLAMTLTGFLMSHMPSAADSMLRQTLKRADDVQGADALKVRLPHIGQAESSPAAAP